MGSSVARDLKVRLAGSSSGAKAALDRVRRFSTQKGASAFCLYFDNYVVVEFSETGHAAYVYPRPDFERHFEAALSADKLRSPGDLKVASKATDKIIHMSGWQGDATELLRRLGIERRGARPPVERAVANPVASPQPAHVAPRPASAPTRDSHGSSSASPPLSSPVRPAVSFGSTLPGIVAMARSAGLEVVDHTATGGVLWIIGGEALDVWFRSRGVDAVFCRGGGKSTNRRPAWYMKSR